MGETLARLAAAQTGDAPLLSWSKFRRWATKDEPSTGTHSIFSVLSPQAIKDDWPAAQALFNPKTHPPVSADVVVADFIDECLPNPRGEQISSLLLQGMLGVSKDVPNPPSDLAESILLFPDPFHYAILISTT